MPNNNANNFGAYIQKAKTVLKAANEIRPMVEQKGGPTLSEAVSSAGGYDAGAYEETAYIPQQTDGGITQAGSKLPKNILESLNAMPPQTANPGFGASVLDGIIPKEAFQQPQRPQQRAQINEDIEYGEKPMPSIESMLSSLKTSKGMAQAPTQVYQQPQQMQSSSIDYSIIKLLIKDAVAEEFKKLKTMLGNEILIVKVGKDLKLVDGKGNIFSGNMKRTGKLD